MKYARPTLRLLQGETARMVCVQTGSAASGAGDPTQYWCNVGTSGDAESTLDRCYQNGDGDTHGPVAGCMSGGSVTDPLYASVYRGCVVNGNQATTGGCFMNGNSATGDCNNGPSA
ncbi:MAG: hypothetical protein GY756_14825 [bacterium]|nr:hypothetical protein [bacterium]